MKVFHKKRYFLTITSLIGQDLDILGAEPVKKLNTLYGDGGGQCSLFLAMQ